MVQDGNGGLEISPASAISGNDTFVACKLKLGNQRCILAPSLEKLVVSFTGKEK